MDLEQILLESFTDYTAYIAQRRALPDARDGLKYSARQLLFSQNREGLTSKKPYKKLQKSVAAATAFCYVHGDSSAAGTFVRMGRSLVQRYFLQDIQGNSGSITSADSYSAPRYLEGRASPLADLLFEGIGHTLESSDWAPTYDSEGVYPLVTSARGYYDLVNGSFGSIGVGLMSSIPQFNLREMNEQICALIKDPEHTVSLLPDFASGGILLNPETTLKSLSKGEGKSALLRGVIRPGSDSNGSFLEILEIPYGVYTETICNELEKAIDAGESPISTFKDLSKQTVQIRCYTKNLEEAEKWLYRNTSVQKHFTIKLIMLDNGKVPKLFSLKEALLAHIAHVKAVQRRDFEFELSQLAKREEILRGLLRAYSILDEVIATIKRSQGRADAISLLCKEYGFTTLQAEAIVDLRLHRLSNLDIKKLESELAENLAKQEGLKELLSNTEKFSRYLIDKYTAVARDFGDSRRTKIWDDLTFETEQDGMPPTEKFFLISSGETYQIADQNEILETAAEDLIEVEPNEEVLILTNTLRCFVKTGKAFTYGEASWVDTLKLSKDEKVLFVGLRSSAVNHDFEVQLDDGETYFIHRSFIETGATPRGKRLFTKKMTAVSISLITGKHKLPQLF